MDVNDIRPKNYLLDIYMNYLDTKVEKGKNGKTEYVILFFFIGLIVLTIVTFTIDDLETRIMLFDLTIPFGGNRIYNTLTTVIGAMLGLIIFKYYHVTTDKRIIFWTEIVNIYRQKYSHWTMPFKLLLNDLTNIFKLADIFQIFNVFLLILGGGLIYFS